MKICIFGGGAIGGFLAAHLANADCEVSIVSRGKNLEGIKEFGCTAVLPEKRISARVRATDDPTELGKQDAIFLTLKSHQLDGALESLPCLTGSDTVFVPPTTGVPHWFLHGMEGQHRDQRLDLIDPNGRQWSYMDPAKVLGCVYWIPVGIISPGVVELHGNEAACPIGEPNGENSERVKRLSRLMQAAGLKAPVSNNIRGEIWAKIVSSLCWNPLAVLGYATMGEIGEFPDVVETSRLMAVEADSLASALGVEVPEPISQRMAFALAAAEHKMSMLQDLEAGRPLELDILQKSVAEMKRLTGVGTPTMDIILPLAALRAKTASSAPRLQP